MPDFFRGRGVDSRGEEGVTCYFTKNPLLNGESGKEMSEKCTKILKYK